MKNLLDHILDELEDAGIELLEEDAPDYSYHKSYSEADRDKVREALSKAIAKSMLEE